MVIMSLFLGVPPSESDLFRESVDRHTNIIQNQIAAFDSMQATVNHHSDLLTELRMFISAESSLIQSQTRLLNNLVEKMNYKEEKPNGGMYIVCFLHSYTDYKLFV